MRLGRNGHVLLGFYSRDRIRHGSRLVLELMRLDMGYLKVLEECGEVIQALTKPGMGKTHLEEEIADLYAALDFTVGLHDLNTGRRRKEKYRTLLKRHDKMVAAAQRRQIRKKGK